MAYKFYLRKHLKYATICAFLRINMIGLIDYGAGNIKSVLNALKFINCKNDIKLISSPKELQSCKKLILPGVGAFKDAMAKLDKCDLITAIKQNIAENKPFLGICLGMQLLFEKSYEFGECDGLGVFKGEIVKFDETRFNAPLKVPHMGWNSCEFIKECALTKGLKKSEYFYFVHSYHACCDDEIVLAKTNYGYDFVSAVAKDNVFGFQPHPEKSQNAGLCVLRNFINL